MSETGRRHAEVIGRQDDRDDDNQRQKDALEAAPNITIDIIVARRLSIA
jgi:hypothetical protein